MDININDYEEVVDSIYLFVTYYKLELNGGYRA